MEETGEEKEGTYSIWKKGLAREKSDGQMERVDRI